MFECLGTWEWKYLIRVWGLRGETVLLLMVFEISKAHDRLVSLSVFACRLGWLSQLLLQHHAYTASYYNPFHEENGLSP